jgi:hypothetical protein
MAINATSEVHSSSHVLLSSDDLTAEFSGDVNGSVAAMMLLHARDTRELAGQARSAEETNLAAQENEQVAKMREKADDLRAAGEWEGITTMIGGGLGVASGFVTMTGSTFKSGELKPGPRGLSDGLSGTGTILGGIGKLGAADLHSDGDLADADATAAANRAEQSKRRLEDIKDMESDARDLARSAVDFYRDVSQTKADGDRAAVFLRG